jgi:hypothetical protein
MNILASESHIIFTVHGKIRNKVSTGLDGAEMCIEDLCNSGGLGPPGLGSLQARKYLAITFTRWRAASIQSIISRVFSFEGSMEEVLDGRRPQLSVRCPPSG